MSSLGRLNTVGTMDSSLEATKLPRVARIPKTTGAGVAVTTPAVSGRLLVRLGHA
jgi:hypothetical protein